MATTEAEVVAAIADVAAAIRVVEAEISDVGRQLEKAPEGDKQYLWKEN